ncbi:MAG: hypothetical protein LUQ20_03880 [Candidatus Methanoperedens sp.]|jgi:hypothetical protein|nr:hypothetical protein [Candidatus Methanoperedens sp.]
MNKKTIFGLLAIFIVVASIGSVAAFGEKLSGMDAAARDNIINAIKANNFTAWKEAMSARLTEENFNKLVERQQVMSQRHEDMLQKRGAMSSERGAFNEQMVQAIEKGDYNAWKEAAVNTPMISKIDNEDDFNILIQLHQAKQDGNYTKVKELSEQLGLPGVSGKNKMSGHFGRGRMN